MPSFASWTRTRTRSLRNASRTANSLTSASHPPLRQPSLAPATRAAHCSIRAASTTPSTSHPASTPTPTLTLRGRRRTFKPLSRKPGNVSRGVWDLVRGLKIVYIGQPTIVTGETKGMPKVAYYAVAAGRVPGVYTTWAHAEEQVKGFAGARYKKFPTEAAAQEFIASKTSASSLGSTVTKGNPYHRVGPKPTQGAGPSVAGPGSIDTHTRAETPPTTASSSTLPPHLQAIAEQGYAFTRSPHYLVVHTDGSALGNGKVGSRAGAGVFWGSYGDAAARNLSERVPGLPQTNNRGELLAVIRALEGCPFPDIPLEVRCDSQYTISCVTTWLPKWLRTNFRPSSSSSESKQVLNVDMIKHLLVLLRRRGEEGRVKFKYVPAHSGVEGNEAADRLAKMGSMMPETVQRVDWLDPDTDRSSAKSGGPTEVEIEIDESWLMTPDELADFEAELEEA